MSAAPRFEFERGPWRFFPPPESGGFGALILEDLILIRIDAGSRSHIEMLGPGDLVSPWAGTGAELSAPSVVTASVVSRARVALLDRRFALRTGRVKLTIWELGYRFGRVTPEGIVVELLISHSQLADIVAAQRPSVSTAVVRLEGQGRIVRTARRTLLLRGEPPEMFSSLTRQSGLAP